MKIIFFTFLVLISQSCFTKSVKFELSKDVFENSAFDLIEHHGEGRYESYLSMEIKFEPMAELFKQLLIKKRVQLTNRGEAHITVITPLEFFDTLKAKVKIGEIDEIARRHGIQKSVFDIVCLGRGAAKISSKLEETFYVVVRSQNLLDIRKEVYQLYLDRNGDPDAFDPESFHPHITLGFTSRDLYESDGVIKNTQSCVSQILIN
ncbi:2'-5' RNA ligase family protein [bacterium]|nr:2'-5' RNA ligase family protein [bacterium]